MNKAIGLFRDNYAKKLASGISEFLCLHGSKLIYRLQDAATRPRSTVYLFGNGGSHAICKCLEYALQSYASSKGLPIRVQTGIDVHQATLLKATGSPGIHFVGQLKAEGADARDMVILISGSGNSHNLCDVAVYTARHSIPTFAFIGSERGELRSRVAPDNCFCVPIEDQQISEDIIQTVAYFVGQPWTDMQPEEWRSVVSHEAKKIKRVIQHIPDVFLAGVAEAIVDTFCSYKSLWVLGFDHPALSVCAEHTAHNLYWDSIYQIDDPPQRRIWSSPTSCDFSGISNDRRKKVVASLAGLREAKETGVALIYSMSTDNIELQETLESFNSLDIPVFLTSATGDVASSYRKVFFHKTGLKEPQIQAGISQIFGHMLGRIIRMLLLRKQNSQVFHIHEPAPFLTDFDLAQRRLLDG